MRECPEGGMAEIDDASVADQSLGRPAVSDGDRYAPGRLVAGVECHQDFRAERIEPGGSREIIGIESLPISHQPAAVRFAVPGSHSCWRRKIRRRGTGSCKKQ